MDATESNGNCQLAITSPIPSTRQRYGLYLPPPTPSPELTPLTSPIITDNSSTPTTLVDSKQNTLPITQERRETPEGFVLPYNTENSTSRTNSSSEAETSFLSPTPNKSYVFTKTLTSDNSIRNVKSSIDLMKDINEENLMSHRSKCFTPEVHISPTLASSSVSNSVKNTTINGTLESFSKSQQKSITTSDFDTVVVVQENPDVLKWDYAGDLASNRLDISRINSQLNIASSTSTSNCCSSSRPINMPIDFIDYDASVALTWPSSGVHLSPPSRYGYLFHKKYNFNRTLNQNNLCNYFLRKNRYGIKIETGLSTSALSAGVLNQGSFISSPDPEDDDGAVYNSLPLHSGDNSLSPYKYRNRQHHGYQQEYRHHHHYSQSPINFHDILDDELESDENSQKLTSKTSDSNDQQQHHHHQEHQETEEEDKEGTDNDNDDKTNNCDEMKFELPIESLFNTTENTVNVTLNQICLNTSQSVTELQHFANRVLKATEAAEEQLRQRINHLSAVMDKTVSDEKAMDEPPEPRARTSLACQSIECTDAYQSLQREDNKQEDTLILQSSTKINHPITNDTNNEIYYDNNEENLRILQSGLQQQQEEEGEHQSEEDQQQQQNDLSSLWTTSISDRTDDASNSFAYINDDVHMKDVSKQQQQQSLIYSTDLPQLLLDDSGGETETVSYLTPPEDAQHIKEGIQTPRQDPNNYSAMTTVTPMNENLHCETGGYVVGVESCRSSIIVDGNLDKEIFAFPISNDAVGHSLLNYAELQTINTYMPISQSILPIDNSQILIPCRERKLDQNGNISTSEEQHKIESSGENSNFGSICMSTSGNTDHLITAVHNVQPFQTVQSSSFLTNNESRAAELYEYIPSRYTGLSTSDVQLLQLNQICQSIPNSHGLVNSTETITIRPDTNQLSFNTNEQKNTNDFLKQNQLSSVSANTIGSVTKKSVTDPFCLNSDERSHQSSIVVNHHRRQHHHYVQPIVTHSLNQTMNCLPPSSISSEKSQDDNNDNDRNSQLDNNHLTSHEAYSCRNHVDGFSSILTSAVSAERPPLPERQTVEGNLHVSKTQSYSTFTLNNEFTYTAKKSNTKMVQTGDLSVETGDVGGGSSGTCPATYRLESESFEHLKQESNSRAKLNECLGMKEYANEVADTGIPEKSTNAGVLPSEYTPSPPPHPHPTTTPRSTLVAQLRYSLLKQKLKLLRARDAYYLRRRIVSHLEKFLDQAITSDSCISLPNSIPEDWDTDTASVLSDLFDDNGGNFSKSGVSVHPTIPEFNPFKNNHSDNIIKSSERKSTSDKCVYCSDKGHSTQEENVQRKESKSAMKKSCFSQDGCCQNVSTEGFKTCTQEGDNSGNRQAKSSSSPVIHQKFQCDRKPTTTTTQFADLKKRAEHQLGEMIMKLKTNQSDSPSQSTTASCPCMRCENCRSILAGYIADGIKFTKSYDDDDDDGGYRQSSKYTPMRKLFVAEACAASGGISWFQPLNQSRFNNKNIERKSAKDNKRSNVMKCLYREIPCRFGVSSTMNQSIGSDDHQQQLGRKYTTATAAAAANCLHTLHNHSCHNGGGRFCDTESNDSSTAKQKSSSEAEEEEIEEDNNVKEKPETLKSSIITKMRCNQHQDTESFSSSITDGVVDLHPGQKNSPISKRITYEIRDNIYGAESNIQTLFRKRMSAWISRCEERQKRLHLASAERRYQKAMDMERTQLFHPTLSDQYTKRPLSSHLSKVDPCHCGFESGVSGCRRGDRSTWRDISNCCVHCFRNSNNQTAQSNRSNNGDGGGWGGDDNRCLNPMSSRKDVRQASVNLPSHRSTLSYKTNSGRRSARSGNETRSYRNYVQNQVYIQESKLAQLRVNRLRMKIYGEKILRSVLQRRGPWSMTFKEI